MFRPWFILARLDTTSYIVCVVPKQQRKSALDPTLHQVLYTLSKSCSDRTPYRIPDCYCLPIFLMPLWQVDALK